MFKIFGADSCTPDIYPTQRCCLFFLFYLFSYARFPRFSKGPVTSRLLGRSKYLNLTPRSLGEEKGTCSFGTGRFVITYPMFRPPGSARRCNQNEWFENSITLITSIKVTIRCGCSYIFCFFSLALTWRASRSAIQNSLRTLYFLLILYNIWLPCMLIESYQVKCK